MSTVIYLENGLCPQNRRVEQHTNKSIAELAPSWQTPFIAFVDGKPILRAGWELVLEENQSLVFVDADSIPMGGGGSSNPLRTVLMLAVMTVTPSIALNMLDPEWTAILGPAGVKMFTAGVGLVGMALVNVIAPAPKLTTPQQAAELAAPSPTYSIQAQGNSARLEAAIPEQFGYLLCYPDFAAQPYVEYFNNEQYLYQLLCIGRGKYVFNPDTDVFIEDTPIHNFAEVSVTVIPPYTGETPLPSSVTTSVEVSGQTLSTTIIGPFVTNDPDTFVNKLAFDFIAPRGIYYANDDGSLASRSVSIIIEYASVDNYGNLTSGWTKVTGSAIAYSANTTTPQRWSWDCNVPNGRYTVRVSRTENESTAAREANSVVWAGLRAYHPDPPGKNYGDVTLLFIKMRASDNLSGLASKKINVKCTRSLPVWNGNTWIPDTPTRSAAWAFAYVCKQVGLTDAQIDLSALLALDAVCNSRGDTFDGRFDNFLSFWEAATKIMQAVRAKPFMQGGIMRVVRDQVATIPVALFSQRNIVKGSFSVTHLMPTPDTADSVDVSYFDSITWKPAKVRSTLAGSTADKPAKIDLFGVISREQAHREGLYQAACNKYRRKVISFQTEMGGFIPSFGDLISIQHDMPAWGQGGDVLGWNASNRYVTLSEQPVFTTGTHYIAFSRRDGSVNGPYAVIPTTDPYTVVLTSEINSFTPYTGLDEDRTRYTFGPGIAWHQPARVTSVKPQSMHLVTIEAVNEDASVHTADTGVTTPVQVFSQLSTTNFLPSISGLHAGYRYIGDRQVVLTWQPSIGAEKYHIEQSSGNGVWEYDSTVFSNRADSIARFGSLTVYRVAAVGIALGPWSEVTPDLAVDMGPTIPSYEISSRAYVTVDGAQKQLHELVTEVKSVIVIDTTPPPTPGNFTLSAAISSVFITQDTIPAYTQGHGHGSTVVYGVVRAKGAPAPIFTDATRISEFYGTVSSYAANPSQTWHVWIKWRTKDGIESLEPAGGLHGVSVTTGEDVSLLLTALTGEITESQLAQTLNSRIDLIDGPVSTAGTVAYQIAQETANRIAANELTTQALLSEVDARVLSVGNEEAARIEANRLQDEAFQKEARINTDRAQSEAYADLANTLSANAIELNAASTVAIARQELTHTIIDGLSAEAALRTILAAKLDTDIGNTLAAISTEQLARVNADSAEAESRKLLSAQLLGEDGTASTSGLIYSKDKVRADADNALSERITLLSAGSAEQFDSANIWYFDTTVEGWAGNGTPTVTLSFLRPANVASDAYVISPVFSLDGDKYKQVRMRIQKVGSPIFAGYLDWIVGSDTTWDISTRRITFTEPTYISGTALITVTAPWSGTVKQLRLSLSSAQTATDYFEIDWVAVGRPSPGASSAQLQELNRVTVDTSNSTSLASKLNTLTATIGDANTGLIKSLATIANDYITAATLNSSVANGQSSLTAKMGPVRVFRQSEPPTQVANFEAITLKDGSTTYLPKLSVGSTWYDTDDGNKPYTWSGTDWVYTPDTSATATQAYINNLETALANPTTATTNAWKDAIAEVTNPVTGLSATKAAVNTLTDTVAAQKEASATDHKSLLVQGEEDGYTQLRNILNGEIESKRLSSTIALVAQDLDAKIVDGLSAEAAARTTLATEVASNKATLVNDYYTKTDVNKVTSNATTTLKAEMEGINGSVGSLKATLTNDYSTTATTTAAAAAAQQALVAHMGPLLVFREPGTARIDGPDIGGPAQDFNYLPNKIILSTGEVKYLPKLSTGAIWYNTANSNKPHTWDGSTWIYTPDVSPTATKAYINNLETALANPTTATTSAWKDAIAEVTNPVTGLSATKAAVNTLTDTVATQKEASAIDRKALLVQGKEDGYTQLRNVLAGEEGNKRISETLAMVAQDLDAKIVDGLSAEATARTTLEATVSGNNATLLNKYRTYADQDVVTASALTQLKADIENKTGSSLGALLNKDYSTTVDMNGAIANAKTQLKAYSGFGVKTFNQVSAPTKRGVDQTVTPNVDVPLEIGDVWINSANLVQKWDGSAWVPASDTSALDSWLSNDLPIIQSQIDSKTESWFQSSDPSTSWTTAALRQQHTGDLWYDNTNKVLKRYTSSNPYSTGSWSDIEDKTAIEAFNKASIAQTTADGKITTFAAPNAPTAFAVGDLWIDTNNENLLSRWDGSAWVPLRDTNASALITNLEQSKIGYATKGGNIFDNNGLITNKAGVDAWNEVHPDDLAVWHVGLPLATAVKQVSVTDADGSTASIEQAFTAQKMLNDTLKAQYTIKLEVGNLVSGFGLTSTNTASAFGILADRFWVSPSAISSETVPETNLYVGKAWYQPSTGYTMYMTQYEPGVISEWKSIQVDGIEQVAAAVSPFVIQASPVGTPGQQGYIPPGVYIRSAFIANGTITNAKIGDMAVDDAKIANLSATKITTGFLSADRIEATSITAEKIDTRGLTIRNAAGDVIVSSGSSLQYQIAPYEPGATVGATSAQISAITNAQNVADSAAYQASLANQLAADKLSKSGADVITGPISLNAETAILVGDTTNGLYLGNTGIVGRKSGQTTFAVDAYGNAVFKGDLTGSNGTFGGNVHGGQFTTGAFTACAWPDAGNYGTYIGPEGLLIGNANNNKYLQITSEGNLYSPGFNVVNGTMTINQANVINTLNIAGNAVTISASAFTASSIDVDWNSYPTGISIQSVHIDNSDNPVYISGSASFAKDGYLHLYRNGILLTTLYRASAISYTDYPGPIGVTYELRANADSYAAASNPFTISVTNRSLFVLGVKR
jgi:hypothetical protein